MADVAKPAAPGTETTVIPAAEPVTAAAPATTTTDATPAPTTAEPTIPPATSAEPGSEPKVEESSTPAVPAKEEAKEAAPVKEEAKPVYEGSLQYNAGSTIKSFIGLKEKYFFYYGEEAVSADKLQHLLKPTKTELKETIAWSHQTGKGLLYYVKHADHKASPKGVIGLSDVEELKPAGTLDISFKLHGHKHILVADSKTIRDGWLLSLEEKVTESKALKDEIHAKESFKEHVEKLGKPAVVAAAVAKTSESTPKKSSEEAKAERSARAVTTDNKKAAAKDRSQSRGKRLLDTIRGKKEGEAAKTEEVKAVEPVPAIPATETIAGPATTETTEPTVAAVAPVISAEEKKDAPEELKNNKARRGSKFLDRIKGAVSPTTEKKPEEVIPPTEKAAEEPITSEAAPVLPLTETTKDADELAPAVAAAPATETAAVTEAPKGEETASPIVPLKDEKRRSSFFGLGSLRKPSEKKVTKEEPKPAEEPIVKADEPVTEAAKPEEAAKPVEDETPAPVAAVATPETPAKEVKEVKDTKAAAPKAEKKENALAGIKRSLSKALHGGEKPKKEKSKPAKKVEEVKEETAAEAEPEKPVVAPVTETTKAPEVKEPAAPAAIGDVVPEAVNIGTPAAPPASATVQATA